MNIFYLYTLGKTINIFNKVSMIGTVISVLNRDYCFPSFASFYRTCHRLYVRQALYGRSERGNLQDISETLPNIRAFNARLELPLRQPSPARILALLSF